MQRLCRLACGRNGNKLCPDSTCRQQTAATATSKSLDPCPRCRSWQCGNCQYVQRCKAAGAAVRRVICQQSLPQPSLSIIPTNGWLGMPANNTRNNAARHLVDDRVLCHCLQRRNSLRHVPLHMPDQPILTDLSNTAIVCFSIPEALQVEPEPLIVDVTDRKCTDGPRFPSNPLIIRVPFF